MLNKPRGYVTTLSDERGRPTAAELVAELRYLGVTQEELMALVKEEGK